MAGKRTIKSRWMRALRDWQGSVWTDYRSGSQLLTVYTTDRNISITDNNGSTIQIISYDDWHNLVTVGQIVADNPCLAMVADLVCYVWDDVAGASLIHNAIDIAVQARAAMTRQSVGQQNLIDAVAYATAGCPD